MNVPQIEVILQKVTVDLSIVARADLKQKLVQHINYLLLNNFAELVQILYKIDIHEQKLKKILQANPQTDAAILIADLLIQRQWEKIIAKQSSRFPDNIPEEDKW